MSLAHSLNFSAWQASALTLSALQFAGVFVLYAPALFWRRKIYFKFFLSWCFIEIRAITQIAMKQSLSTKFRDLFLFWVSHGVYNHFLNPPPPSPTSLDGKQAEQGTFTHCLSSFENVLP